MCVKSTGQGCEQVWRKGKGRSRDGKSTACLERVRDVTLKKLRCPVGLFGESYKESAGSTIHRLLGTREVRIQFCSTIISGHMLREDEGRGAELVTQLKSTSWLM